uniref:Importin N-terminal domain-containing protein n=1 Tax=Oryza rufipogon TaxID=4529 RepID=A0A0E0NTP9_ORYRU
MALSAGDVQFIYSVLANSLSADAATRQPAEALLAQCEARQGFCSCLLAIITSRGEESDDDVRLLAAVHLKNCVTRCWRNSVDSPAIDNEEKVYIRKSLLLNMREENGKIALQLAALIARIVYFDYPKEWSDVFSVLAQQLQTSDVFTSYQVSTVLFRSLKKLSKKRLAFDQRNYSEITVYLFDYIWNLWKSNAQIVLQNFSVLSQHNSSLDQSNDLLLIYERWLVCLKIIRELICSGYASDSTTMQEVCQIKEVCPVLLGAIQSILPYYPFFKERQAKPWSHAKRACIKLMKVLIILQDKYPYSFAHETVLPAAVDFCLTMITNPEQADTSFEEFLVQCMVLVKLVLECQEYKPGQIGFEAVGSSEHAIFDQRKNNLSATASSMVMSVLPADRIMLLCDILIRRHFIYTATDMNEWHSNPESFHHEQNLLQCTEKRRPCAEALFIILFDNYGVQLAPFVASIIHDVKAVSPPLEIEITAGMLLKEAAYTAAGHVFDELSKYLSFDEWFCGYLSIDLSNGNPNMCIIRRRIALLLGQCAFEIKGVIQKEVCDALVGLLGDQDMAVRLAACSSLCYAFRVFGIWEVDLLECIPTCWAMCFKLIGAVQEFDSKVQVLSFILVLLNYVGDDRIIPFVSELSQFFLKTWEESSGECLLQIELLDAIRTFISSLGYNSPLCYGMVLPILQYGMDVDSPNALNLLEDTVLLLEATLSNAPSIVPQLLDCFPYLVGIMNGSFNHLEIMIKIIEHYIVFAGSDLLQSHATSLESILDTIVGNADDKGLLTTLPIIDLLVLMFPQEVPPLISSALQKLVFISLSGGDEHYPSRTAVCVTSAAILARLLLLNRDFLAQLLSEPALIARFQQAGINQNLLLLLVDWWINKVDDASSIEKKVYAMALSVILTANIPGVIEKLGDILRLCTSVIIGGHGRTTSDDSSDDTISSLPLSDDPEYSNTSKEFKKAQIRELDPIRKASLVDMLRENLKECAALHGDAVFNAAISRIDPLVIAQLWQALEIG